MKKQSRGLCLLLLTLTLLSCAPTAPDAADEELAIVCGEATLTVGMSEERISEVLGRPVSVSEAESCAGQGTDRMYTYEGVRLYVFAPTQGKAYVRSITLTDDRAALLQGGLTVGSLEDEVHAVLGEPQAQTDAGRIYRRGEATLSLTVRDGLVTALTLSEE